MIKKTGGGGKTLGYSDGAQGQKKQGSKQPQKVSDLNYKDVPKGKGVQSSQS